MLVPGLEAFRKASKTQSKDLQSCVLQLFTISLNISLH